MVLERRALSCPFHLPFSTAPGSEKPQSHQTLTQAIVHVNTALPCSYEPFSLQHISLIFTNSLLALGFASVPCSAGFPFGARSHKRVRLFIMPACRLACSCQTADLSILSSTDSEPVLPTSARVSSLYTSCLLLTNVSSKTRVLFGVVAISIVVSFYRILVCKILTLLQTRMSALPSRSRKTASKFLSPSIANLPCTAWSS